MVAVKKPRQPYRRGDRDLPHAYITFSIGSDAAPAMTMTKNLATVQSQGSFVALDHTIRRTTQISRGRGGRKPDHHRDVRDPGCHRSSNYEDPRGDRKDGNENCK